MEGCQLVADMVGAGDSFISAFLSAMERDGALGLGGIASDEAQLAQRICFAAKASAITRTPKGSNPPALAEVEAF
jgi:fructokinase